MGVGVTASAKKKTRKIGASVLWFRPEYKTTVKWGGAPEKKVEKIEGREVLSPRSSFTQWKEVTKNQSIPWSQQDIIAAQKFRATVLQRLSDINL
jgi:light-regulated signal transduction histidine kinase (bacteriophytochrome)